MAQASGLCTSDWKPAHLPAQAKACGYWGKTVPLLTIPGAPVGWALPTIWVLKGTHRATARVPVLAAHRSVVRKKIFSCIYAMVGRGTGH